MPNPPQPAAERFAAMLFHLCQAVAAQTGWGLSLQMISLVITRIDRIRLRFAELAARIAEGRHVPRKSTISPRKRPGQPPPQNRLPNRFGWLLPLERHAVATRAQLESLLLQPDMAALLAADPAAMRRPLRSLCWMLAVTPPPILALPAKPRPPPAEPEPEPPPPRRRRTRLGFYKDPPMDFQPAEPPRPPRRRSGRPQPRAGPPLPA
jgi:hypothetical protein